MDFSNTNWKIRSSSLVIQIPAYIYLHKVKERVGKIPPVFRKTLLRRDANQCQYRRNRKQLSIDHIISRSKGGQDTRDNAVIACATYNGRKGGYTPEPAGIKLATKPKAPIHPIVIFAEPIWQQIFGNKSKESITKLDGHSFETNCPPPNELY